MGSKRLLMQPSLLTGVVDNSVNDSDVVYTPPELARAIIEHFKPQGRCLDPCRGKGAFYNALPANKDWCEIHDGVDFFAYKERADWIISNPPYSCLLDWICHSFEVADNIVYLVPIHRIWGSFKFLTQIRNWGGIAEICVVGTGTTAGFDFGHALGAIYFKKGYRGSIKMTEIKEDWRW